MRFNPIHPVCSLLLQDARASAAATAVHIPPYLKAHSFGTTWIVRGNGIDPYRVQACCASRAKAKFIHTLIRKAAIVANTESATIA